MNIRPRAIWIKIKIRPWDILIQINKDKNISDLNPNKVRYNDELMRENIIMQHQKILRKGREEEFEDDSDF